MGKITTSIILTAIGVGATIWAGINPLGGISWFPGFVAAVYCFTKVFDINRPMSGERHA